MSNKKSENGMGFVVSFLKRVKYTMSCKFVILLMYFSFFAKGQSTKGYACELKATGLVISKHRI